MTEDDTFVVDNARRQWAEGARRLEQSRAANPGSARDIDRSCSAIHAELTRRMGQVFSMAELAQEYARAEDWASVEAHDAAPDTPDAWELEVVMNAAFDRFCRQAKDYAP